MIDLPEPLKACGITLSETGLEFVSKISEDQCDTLAQFINRADSVVNWMKGDLYNAAPWGNKEAMCDKYGWSYNTVRMYATVCDSVKIDKRLSNLTFSHYHRAYTKKAYHAFAAEFLAIAAERKWSVSKLESELANRLGEDEIDKKAKSAPKSNPEPFDPEDDDDEYEEPIEVQSKKSKPKSEPKEPVTEAQFKNEPLNTHSIPESEIVELLEKKDKEITRQEKELARLTLELAQEKALTKKLRSELNQKSPSSTFWEKCTLPEMNPPSDRLLRVIFKAYAQWYHPDKIDETVDKNLAAHVIELCAHNLNVKKTDNKYRNN